MYDKTAFPLFSAFGDYWAVMWHCDSIVSFHPPPPRCPNCVGSRSLKNRTHFAKIIWRVEILAVLIFAFTMYAWETCLVRLIKVKRNPVLVHKEHTASYFSASNELISYSNNVLKLFLAKDIDTFLPFGVSAIISTQLSCSTRKPPWLGSFHWKRYCRTTARRSSTLRSAWT